MDKTLEASLIEAIKRDNIPYINQILRNNYALNKVECGKYKDSLTHVACKYFKIKTLSFLLSYEIGTFSKDYYGNTPLHYLMLYYSCYVKCLDNIQSMIASSSEARYRDFLTQLENSNPKDMVKILIDHGAFINEQNKAGQTPLHLALINNVPEDIIYTLLDNGAGLNILDVKGKAPKCYANNQEILYKLELYISENDKIIEFARNCFERNSFEEIVNLVNNNSISINDLFKMLINLYSLITSRNNLDKSNVYVLDVSSPKLFIEKIYMLTQDDEEFSLFIPLILRFLNGPLHAVFSLQLFLKEKAYNKSLESIKSIIRENPSYRYYYYSHYFADED